MKKVPEHGPCFICGSQNPGNIGLTWWEQEDGTIVSDYVLTERQQGGNGMSHGGATAAVLDEVMGVAVWRAGHPVATLKLEVEYRLPILVGSHVQVKGSIVDQIERVIRARGEIILDNGQGEIAAVGRAVFVEAPHLFEKPMYRVE